ncbi:hypothetical protein RB599_009315 [Gaeumannomyces hyphopodioides]
MPAATSGPAKRTCSSIHFWHWATLATPIQIPPHRRLSRQALARWEGIRGLWSAEPSTLGGGADPATPQERLYIWEQPKKNALASISHRSDPYHRRDEPQHPLGEATPIILETPALDEAPGPPELSRARSSANPGGSWPSTSPEPEEEEEGAAGCAAVMATGCGTSTDSGGDSDGDDDDDDYYGDYNDDDNDPHYLTRRIVAMAAADLRAKASSRSSGSSSSSSSATTQTTTTDQEARGPFKLRWDAPIFTPMVR